MNSNKIPFNLEKAKARHPLVTRDGKMVTEFHRFETRQNIWKCSAIIDGDLFCFNDSGRRNQGLRESPYDLFLAPTEVTMWVNVYEANGKWYSTGIFHDTESEAISKRTEKAFIATVPVTFNIWKP
jgi:hypothetical protein